MTGRWRFISDHHMEYGIQRLCRIFSVSRSGFYRWRAAGPARVARAAAEADLTEQIRGIHTETKGAYGVPRITRELRDAFAVACRRHGIRRSMGRVGSSYDNAMAESFFASIKRELLHGERWRQNSEARMAVFSWLAWYNNRRRHSALGHLSPVEFERQAIKSSSLNLAA